MKKLFWSILAGVSLSVAGCYESTPPHSDASQEVEDEGEAAPETVPEEDWSVLMYGVPTYGVQYP